MKKLGTLPKVVYLLTCGDFPDTVNRHFWAAHEAVEERLLQSLRDIGVGAVRAHSYKPTEKHGFLVTRKEVVDAFSHLDPKAPLIVLDTLGSELNILRESLPLHQGPILVCAPWLRENDTPTGLAGTAGLRGLLEMNAMPLQTGKAVSLLWSGDFSEKESRDRLEKWLKTGTLKHPAVHAVPSKKLPIAQRERQMGESLARELRERPVLIGTLNAGVPKWGKSLPASELERVGVYHETLNQTTFYAETVRVSDEEARDVYRAMMARGMQFQLGENDATELTLRQVLTQCKMYIASLRLADRHGFSLFGISYLPGLESLLPIPGFVEGMLDSPDRPPIKAVGSSRVLLEGKPLLCHHRGDLPAALDALLNYRLAVALGQPPETCSYDIRWGDTDPTETVDGFVWTLQNADGVPPAHFEGGWKVAESVRQSVLAYPTGGGTLWGIARRGEIVWSRPYLHNGKLAIDLGRGRAVTLPRSEVQRRLNVCSPECPIMNAVFNNVSRDQFMGRHPDGCIQIAYANSPRDADRLLQTKIALAAALGIEAFLCGEKK